ncbi:uncharacterized protein LY89DRAFT_236300 [Mollisia scopiformis]|uniref:Uncharacterized protein n=1 Tax=Mollisia scopiformis TaxID=149040 RepID=A0A194WTY8_MOLSC|nr:uncharacterized protein LY89DRAFT_236300 [Mollisia scopiformis]KUJ11072.1 hypothetical protein LY89DRAFT_236300 [Mollisia scopiformis]
MTDLAQHSCSPEISLSRLSRYLLQLSPASPTPTQLICAASGSHNQLSQGPNNPNPLFLLFSFSTSTTTPTRNPPIAASTRPCATCALLLLLTIDRVGAHLHSRPRPFTFNPVPEPPANDQSRQTVTPATFSTGALTLPITTHRDISINPHDVLLSHHLLVLGSLPDCSADALSTRFPAYDNR